MRSPHKSLKTAKRLKTAEELEALLAERAGVPVAGVAVRPVPEGGWVANLIKNRPGNIEGLARFNTLASELRREFQLKG